MPKYLLGILILSLLSNCNFNHSSTSDTTAKDLYFFDLAGFFDQEIQHLKGEKIKAHKKVQYNDKEDVLQPQQLDYEKELAVFVHSDINKLSWREKYQADTVRNGNNIRSIHYRALDDQLKTRNITIDFKESEVAQITIRNRLKSIMANNWQELEYVPGKGYQVQGTQQMRWAGKDKMGIQVEFIP